MCVCWVWRTVCVLGWVCVSVCVNVEQYELNYLDDYDNEITTEQEGESPEKPCQAAEFSRWDRLFIALEDSHMRQSMLLEALETCCQGSIPSLEALLRGQAQQASLRLQRGLAELHSEGEERERRLNATLEELLQSSREQNARLGHLELTARPEQPMGAKHGGTGEGLGRIATRPGRLGAGLGSAAKQLGSVQSGGLIKEQDVTSSLSPDTQKLETALVTVATELQRVQAQLSRLMERGMVEREGERGWREEV